MRTVKVIHEEITQKAIKSLFSTIRTDTRTGKRDLAIFYYIFRSIPVHFPAAY